MIRGAPVGAPFFCKPEPLCSSTKRHCRVRTVELSSSVDPASQYDSKPRPSPEPNLEGGHDPRRPPKGQRTFHADEDQQVSTGPSVEPRPVPAGYPRSPVGRPTTLPEGVETESREQIGSAFHAVAPRSDSGDETGAYVDPGGDANAESCLNTRGVGDNGVEASFQLNRLPWTLGERDAGRGQRQEKCCAKNGLPGSHRCRQATLERVRPRQSAIV